jgi:hypothetical protein
MENDINDMLLPCPFCGEIPRIFYWPEYTMIVCQNCGIYQNINHYSDEKAIKAWNTRINYKYKIVKRTVNLFTKIKIYFYRCIFNGIWKIKSYFNKIWKIKNYLKRLNRWLLK